MHQGFMTGGEYGMIFDAHVHLTGKKQEGSTLLDPEGMIARMDFLGIDMALLMSMSENGESSAHEMRFVAKRHPDRFRFMCNIDCCDIASVYDRLSEWKKSGALGIGELIINKRIDDPFLEEVFSSAEKLSMPVTIHISPREGVGYGIVDEPRLPLLEKTLEKHPGLVILGHSQCFWTEISADAPDSDEGRNSWGKGPVKRHGRLEKLFRTYPNLYGDLSANSGSCAIMRDVEYGLWFLKEFGDRLVFATDTADKHTKYPLKEYLEEKRNEGLLDDGILKKIFYLNAARLFNL